MMDNAQYADLTLEKVKLASHRVLENLPGLHIDDLQARVDHMIDGMILDLRAYVLASARHEPVIEVSDEVVDRAFVPDRPVRDGLWLWVSEHTPGGMSDFFMRRVRFRGIPIRRIVRLQHSHYYCCPHLSIVPDRDQIHLGWLHDHSAEPNG